MKRSLREALKSSAGESAGSVNQKTPVVGDVNELIGKYSGMSEGELMSALLEAVQKQKADGSFDRDELMNGVNSILPMLNDEQRKKLFGIVGLINAK